MLTGQMWALRLQIFICASVCCHAKAYGIWATSWAVSCLICSKTCCCSGPHLEPFFFQVTRQRELRVWLSSGIYISQNPRAPRKAVFPSCWLVGTWLLFCWPPPIWWCPPYLLKTEFPGQVPWPYFVLWQSWPSGGSGLSAPFCQKLPLLYCPKWSPKSHQCTASVLEPHPFPGQSGSVHDHSKQWDYVFTPGAVNSRCTPLQLKANCGLYSGPEGMKKIALWWHHWYFTTMAGQTTACLKCETSLPTAETLVWNMGHFLLELLVVLFNLVLLNFFFNLNF